VNLTEKRQAIQAAYAQYAAKLPVEHRRHHGALFVPGVGPLDARIAIVGEAPGAKENEQLRPFVGPAGEELDRVLDLNGLRRSRIFITNAVKFRPPNNSTPKPWERAYGRSCLVIELGVVEPELVVLAGSTAFNTVFPERKFKEWVGHIICTDVRDYLTVWHPSFCLRDPAYATDNDHYFQMVRRYDG
jgi:DNA polymerase